MSVQVYVPTPYREFTGGASKVEARAETVGDLLRELVERFPGLEERLLGEAGGVPGHLNVYVNEAEIRSLDGEATALHDGDEVALIPAMAGGAYLTDAQLERYSRHVRLGEVGLEGQRKLLDSKVLLVGAGALGSPNAIYLAAAGVGTIGIVDADVVDRSNLQRQVLHFDRDVGRPKTQSAQRHLEDLNPDVRVITHPTYLTSENALEIIGGYDVVVNGSDNFPTRYLVNDACVMAGKPLVDASILKFEGQATVFLPGRGCYRCLFPSPPPPGTVPSCAEAGIIGALAGHLGTLQALETVKILLGIGDSLANRLLLYDALSAEYRVLRWSKRDDCPVCGRNPTITELIDYNEFCGVPGGAHQPVEITLPAAQGEVGTANGKAKPAASERDRFTVAELLARGAPELSAAEAGDLFDEAGVQVIDVREPREWEQGHIKGANLIPLGSLGARAGEVDPDRPAIFVCHSGERSGVAVDAFLRAGYDKVFNLKGGMLAWANNRLPIEQ